MIFVTKVIKDKDMLFNKSFIQPVLEYGNTVCRVNFKKEGES